MDDRELLELAARAAGIRYDKEASKPHPTSGAFFGLWLQIDGEPYEGQRRRWNALTDDGDALRLAVKLEIHVQPSGRYAWASTFSVTATEESAQDPYAATRRAITRAAAEIGKAMQEKETPR